MTDFLMVCLVVFGCVSALLIILAIVVWLAIKLDQDA